jgi:hypothetical protein
MLVWCGGAWLPLGPRNMDSEKICLRTTQPIIMTHCQLGDVPWAHEVPPVAASATARPPLPWAHPMPLLPRWPHALHCGFRHRLPSPGLTKCQWHFGRMTPSATVCSHDLLRIRPPSALPNDRILPLWPHADRCCSGRRLPSPALMSKVPLLQVWPHAHC